MKQINRTSWAISVAILLAIFSIMPFGESIPGVYNLEKTFQDMRIALLAEQTSPHKKIVIVEITEQTYAKLKRRSPLDRLFLGNLIKNLELAGAKAIGVDILIDQITNTKEDLAFTHILNNINTPVFLEN